MPKLKPVTEEFFETAPSRFAHTWTVPQSAEAVWAELVRDGTLDWCRPLSTQWTSARPLGLGSTRRAKVLGLVSVNEYFFVWEEGRRYAFYGTDANVPVFESLAEDYVVEPTGAAQCRFTWRAAVAPTALGRPGGPVNKLLFNRLFADTGRYFKAT